MVELHILIGRSLLSDADLALRELTNSLMSWLEVVVIGALDILYLESTKQGNQGPMAFASTGGAKPGPLAVGSDGEVVESFEARRG